MRATALLSKLAGSGIRLSVERDRLRAEPRSALTEDTRALIKAHKDELIAALASDALPDPKAEARRQRVLVMLAERPNIRYAVLTDTEADPEAVILALAIRGRAMCELRIPRAKYDPFLLLDLIKKHMGTVQ